MSLLDYQVARTIMMFSFSTAIITMLIKLYWFSQISGVQRTKQINMSMPNIIWLAHVIVFYSYVILIMPHYPVVPEVWFYAWGATLVLHQVINTLGVLIAKMITVKYG